MERIFLLAYLMNYFIRVNIVHAHFGRHYEYVLVGHIKTRWTQTVPVQYGTWKIKLIFLLSICKLLQKLSDIHFVKKYTQSNICFVYIFNLLLLNKLLSKKGIFSCK